MWLWTITMWRYANKQFTNGSFSLAMPNNQRINISIVASWYPWCWFWWLTTIVIISIYPLYPMYHVYTTMYNIHTHYSYTINYIMIYIYTYVWLLSLWILIHILNLSPLKTHRLAQGRALPCSDPTPLRPPPQPCWFAGWFISVLSTLAMVQCYYIYIIMYIYIYINPENDSCIILSSYTILYHDQVVGFTM